MTSGLVDFSSPALQVNITGPMDQCLLQQTMGYMGLNNSVKFDQNLINIAKL